MKKLFLNALALSFIASAAIASADVDDFEMMDTPTATAISDEENKENSWRGWAYENGKKVVKKGARRVAGTAVAKLSAPVAVAAGEAANAATFTAVTAATGNPILGFAAGQTAKTATVAAVPVIAYQVGAHAPEIAKGVGRAGKAAVRGGKAVVRGGIDLYYGPQEQEGGYTEVTL